MEITIDKSQFVNNSSVVINDITTPLTAYTGDYEDVYIGISATSICSVDITVDSAFSDVGECEILNLTNPANRPNTHALHLRIEKYEGGAGLPETRVFTFNMNVNACCCCIFKDTNFYITQHGPDMDNPYLIFTAEEANTKIGMLPAFYKPNLLVSLDEGETWSNWDCVDESWNLNKITLENIGDTLYICGMNTTGFSQGITGNTFIIDGKSSVDGNIMKLIDYTQDVLEIPNDYCFASLFYNCTGLTSMPDLPATILKNGCYAMMFYGCTGLTNIPSNLLPATVLSNECYSFMFFGCTNITTAPTLPAQTLVKKCYEEMFGNCENLNRIECLAINGISQDNSTSSWVEGVQTNSGTFIKHPSATAWERGVNGIPDGQGWSVQNAQV